MNKKILFGGLCLLVLAISFVSSLTISEVSSGNFNPGDENTISIKIKNNMNEDVSDASLNLVFAGKPFIPVGSSEDQIDEILEDDTERFSFKIKAASDIKPGDYEIPYSLSYKNEANVLKTESGTIGLTVQGNPDLEFVLIESNQILNQKGKLELKIINKGFGQAKFASVKLSPVGFILLSERNVYIGSINSDDFETASFDVIFNQESAVFSAIVEYRDFDNNLVTKEVGLPIIAYTKEKAIRLGIIQKSNTLLYSLVIVILVIIFFVYRSLKKRARLKRAREANKQGM